MLFNVNGKKVFVTPPPGSGILIGFILNILKGYNMTKKDMENMDNTILTHHRIVEGKYNWL
jgi:gamma-glutamyltranspeptidase / glutathione hydrolase / leukotriene-C4 hydrolase